MSKYITSIAVLGVLLIAVPAFADYELFKTWRQEKGKVYDEGAEVVTLGILGRGGNPNGTDGAVYFTQGNDAWTVEYNYTGVNNRYWINYDGSDTTVYQDMGIALTGGLGSGGILGGGATGLQGSMSVEVEGSWYTLALALSSLASTMGVTIEKQSYLNGAKTTSMTVSTATDAMQTFLWSDLFTGLLGGGGGSGGVGVQFQLVKGSGLLGAPALRNGSSLALVAIRGDQPEIVDPSNAPEPATLALMGLGLAGLGVVRRRMKK